MKAPTIQLLLILCILKKKMLPTYISNHNSTREKAIILLMIPNKEQWHYFAVKE